MSIVFDNCRIDYAHLTDSTFDKFKNKEIYKALIKIPNTEANIEALENEIKDAVDYGTRQKAEALAKRDIEPKTPNVEDMISPDSQWIQINVDSTRPFTVYNEYGEVVEDCPLRRIDNAQVEMFGFVWTMPEMKRWGVKLYAKAIAVFDNMEVQESKFAFKKRTSEPKVSDSAPWDDEQPREEKKTTRKRAFK